MSRLLYITLLRLHPRPFRERFGDEMLGIFDEHAGRSRGALFVDVFVSLTRQWVLRPAHHEPALAATAQPSSIPVFHMLDSELPRRSALIQGAILSLVLFSAASLTIGRGGNSPRLLLIGARYPRPHVLPVDRASVIEAQPTTEIKMQPSAVDPLYQLANFYFGIVRALDILDADRDRIISASEITAAPTALARLDRDHDGKLSPEECGFSSAEIVKTSARLEFMRLNPVLAALDADADGEISAGEIRTSSAALRTLDANRDGSLTPVELLQELEKHLKKAKGSVGPP